MYLLGLHFVNSKSYKAWLRSVIGLLTCWADHNKSTIHNCRIKPLVNRENSEYGISIAPVYFTFASLSPYRWCLARYLLGKEWSRVKLISQTCIKRKPLGNALVSALILVCWQTFYFLKRSSSGRTKIKATGHLILALPWTAIKRMGIPVLLKW